MQQHGGNIVSFAKEIGCAPSEVIDLSSNINFVKPNIELDFNGLSISAYPNYDALEKAIASLYKIERRELELFNGATTAIYALFRELTLKQCVLYAPCYGEYEKSAKLNGYTIDHIHRFDNLYRAVPKNALVVFVNPSTPDGNFYDIEKLMHYWIKQKCTILVDESFLDFTPYRSVIPYLKAYDKLYILKSMTKFYASAGIRIGALLSCEKNIQAIKTKEPLWKISEFDSRYLQSALKEKTFKERSQKENRENKEFLITLFQQFKYTKKIYPSSANFILVEFQTIDTIELQKVLSNSKILIRNCANFYPLNNHHARIAVKSIKKLDVLKEALLSIEEKSV